MRRMMNMRNGIIAFFVGLGLFAILLTLISLLVSLSTGMLSPQAKALAGAALVLCLIIGAALVFALSRLGRRLGDIEAWR
ncbi:MAG: hypothetical protein U0822_25675 [Anaerolineae bacterium]